MQGAVWHQRAVRQGKSKSEDSRRSLCFSFDSAEAMTFAKNTEENHISQALANCEPWFNKKGMTEEKIRSMWTTSIEPPGAHPATLKTKVTIEEGDSQLRVWLLTLENGRPVVRPATSST